MSYQHQTRDQRYQFSVMHKMMMSYREIADNVGCHHGTVGREVRRNRSASDYRAAHAHKQAVQRRHAASSRTRIDPACWVAVEKRLRVD